MSKPKTIPAEYLKLRLDQVLLTASRKASPTTGAVRVSALVAALRGLAAKVARDDAKRAQAERAWLREQLDSLPPSATPKKTT